jgi:hypothetical protein
MTEPIKITINTDGITEEQKATEKFKSAYREMLAVLTAPGFIPVLCAHEAAHAIYFTAAGMKQFEPRPTRIYFDPTINDSAGDLAAIQLLDYPTWTPGKFDEWLFNTARGHAAGGVVARKLMPSSDGGDKDDKKRFKDLCDGFNKDPKVKIDWERYWKAAQDAIAQDLDNPEFIKAIQREAEALRPQFGL